ncbi:hypothetical protein [Gloeobacter morelensis]|nr:hypothetical protein [Gloeobacter morelensis]
MSEPSFRQFERLIQLDERIRTGRVRSARELGTGLDFSDNL